MSEIHSLDIKLVCYLKETTKSIDLTQVKTLGAYKGQKRAKNRPNKGSKTQKLPIIKPRDFKVTKKRRGVVKLVFHVNETTRIIFLTAVRF